MARSKALIAPLLCALAFAAGAGERAYVTNQSSSDLSIVDLDAGREIARIPVPGQPAGVAVAPALGAVFVVSPEDKTLRRFSADGALEASLTLDGGPIGVAVGAGAVFVSDWYNARIWVIDAEAMTIRAELATGAAPAGLAVSPDGALLAAADRDADQLSLFSLPDLAPVARPPVGERPFAVAFGPDGLLYAADVGSNTLSIVDPARHARIAALETGARPYGIAFAQGRIFVTNQYADSVSVFERESRAALGVIEAGEYPEGAQATFDGRRVLVANWFSNTLSVIDAETLETVREIDVGDGPRAFGRFVMMVED